MKDVTEVIVFGSTAILAISLVEQQLWEIIRGHRIS